MDITRTWLNGQHKKELKCVRELVTTDQAGCLARNLGRLYSLYGAKKPEGKIGPFIFALGIISNVCAKAHEILAALDLSLGCTYWLQLLIGKSRHSLHKEKDPILLAKRQSG